MSSSPANKAPQVNDQVIFDEGDGEHTSSLGVVTRVWSNAKAVTVVSDGRTFVRLVHRVVPVTS